MPESKKQKLTLSVNKAIVEKAREIGLNLSEITENALRALTDVPKESDLAAVSAKYKEVFSTMLPLLAKYGLSIQIGSVEWTDGAGQPAGIGDSYVLEPSGKITRYSDANDSEATLDIEQVPLTAFHEPSVILNTFLDKLTEAKVKNKERITYLLMTKRIIEAVTESMVKEAVGKEASKENRLIAERR